MLAATTLGATAADPDLYLIGANVDGSYWTLGTNKMTSNGNGIYTWSGSQLGSGFKINDGSWSGSYNIGSSGPVIELGKPYTTSNSGSSGNISFSDASYVVTNPTVTFDLNSLILTVTGEGAGGEKTFSLAGTFNDWNGGDSNYSLKESNGVYVGRYNMPADAQFQIVLNNQTWYGFKNPSETEIKLTEANPSMTVETSTGNENNFMFANTSATDITFIFDYATMHLTVSLEEAAVAPEGPDLYLVGDNVNGESWALLTNKMSNKGNGVYTWSGTVLGSGFKINDGTWDNVEYNIGAPEGSEMTVGQAFTVITGNDAKDILFANSIGRVENASVTLDYNKKTLTVTGTPVEVNYEKGFYIIGEVEGCGWDPTLGYPMKEITTGVYQAKNVVFTGSYFAFTEELGNWTTVNAHRYGPSEKDASFIVGEANPMTYGVDASWNIAMDTYNFTVDTNAMTAKAVRSADVDAGVDVIGADHNGEEVIFNLQGVRVNRENAAPGLYIVNGKKVILK